jgi:hypothetical protein
MDFMNKYTLVSWTKPNEQDKQNVLLSWLKVDGYLLYMV